ncbi:SDR family NAD(P)-dependent oxidoreductase [Terrarubrum flagellatum]|uniref:SDR family NAD(P)-dependent oxidoreductase n=1 Tax=Terrirubrum flagellatum TaxID=2895980 RepID=UPI003145318E
MSADPPLSPNRRRMLTMAGSTAGAAAGFAAGVALGQGARPASQRPSGRRRFDGKVVAITGATSGIGRAAAKAFAAEGAKVAFCGRREELGRAVEAEISLEGGEAFYVRADVRVEDDVQAFIAATVARYGGLNVAFNNAGVTLEKPLHALSASEFDDVIGTNLRGVFLAIKYQAPHLIAAGGGAIVVTASSNAIATQAKRAAYTASKRALIGLVQSAALDYADKGVRINALLPGTTNTDFVRRVAGMQNAPDAVWNVAAAQWAKLNVPGFGRMATAEEIAAAALTLASDDHAFMTGSSFVIDGGKTAHA